MGNTFEDDRRERKAWLAGLSAGDAVVCESGHIMKTRTIGRVVRITSKYFVVNGWNQALRYRRVDGQLVSGTWDKRIQPFAQEVRDAMRQNALVARLDRMEWHTLPLATLEQVAALLDVTSKKEGA